jgi:hypothetical protein
MVFERDWHAARRAQVKIDAWIPRSSLMNSGGVSAFKTQTSNAQTLAQTRASVAHDGCECNRSKDLVWGEIVKRLQNVHVNLIGR